MDGGEECQLILFLCADLHFISLTALAMPQNEDHNTTQQQSKSSQATVNSLSVQQHPIAQCLGIMSHALSRSAKGYICPYFFVATHSANERRMFHSVGSSGRPRWMSGRCSFMCCSTSLFETAIMRDGTTHAADPLCRGYMLVIWNSGNPFVFESSTEPRV